jgi:hypothetical protein
MATFTVSLIPNKIQSIINMLHENIWDYKKFPNPVHQGEKIILVVRQDEAVIVRQMTSGFFVLIFIFFGKLVLQNYSNLDENGAWFYFINMSFYLIVCAWLLWFAFWCHNYFLSFWTLTNHRIIQFQQNSFFQADVSSIWYKNIQKQELVNESASNTIKNIADLVLTMAGEGEQDSKKTLPNIPNPHQVLATIRAFLK